MSNYLDYNGVKYLWRKILGKFAPLTRAIPSGGTTGQVLAKSSNTDFAVGWTNAPDDFITEQGTSGIWTYRKWNSGVAECWGIITHNITSWSSWGSLYEALPGYNENYPTNLFIDIPRFFATPLSTGGISGVEIYTGATSSRTPDMYLLRPNAGNTNISGSVNFYAIGKWK